EGTYKYGKMDGVGRDNVGLGWGEKTYRDGILHGPFNTRAPLIGTTEGQYVEGDRNGEWVKWRRRQDYEIKSVQHYRRGIRDGKWEYVSTNAKGPIEIEFKDGHVVS